MIAAWDLAIFRFLNQVLTAPWLDVAMPRITDGTAITWFVVVLIVVSALRGGDRVRLALVAAIFAVGLANSISDVLKLAVERPRPFLTHEVRLLVGRGLSRSFPSSHASNTAAAAAVLLLLAWRRWRYGAAFALLAFLVGWSRVYVGVHYPSDVVGGWFVGCVSAAIVAYVFRRCRPVATVGWRWRVHLPGWVVLGVLLVSVFRVAWILASDFGPTLGEIQSWQPPASQPLYRLLVGWAAATGDLMRSIRWAAVACVVVSYALGWKCLQAWRIPSAQSAVVLLIAQTMPILLCGSVVGVESAFVLPCWLLCLLGLGVWWHGDVRRGLLLWAAGAAVATGVIGLGGLSGSLAVLLATLLAKRRIELVAIGVVGLGLTAAIAAAWLRHRVPGVTLVQDVAVRGLWALGGAGCLLGGWSTVRLLASTRDDNATRPLVLASCCGMLGTVCSAGDVSGALVWLALGFSVAAGWWAASHEAWVRRLTRLHLGALALVLAYAGAQVALAYAFFDQKPLHRRQQPVLVVPVDWMGGWLQARTAGKLGPVTPGTVAAADSQTALALNWIAGQDIFPILTNSQNNSTSPTLIVAQIQRTPRGETPRTVLGQTEVPIPQITPDRIAINGTYDIVFRTTSQP